jgi:hypothetical protein
VDGALTAPVVRATSGPGPAAGRGPRGPMTTGVAIGTGPERRASVTGVLGTRPLGGSRHLEAPGLAKAGTTEGPGAIAP